MRNQESMSANFTTKPQDVFTIVMSGGLSSSIPVRVTNERTDEDFYLSFTNNLDAWKFLVKVDDIEARKVMVEVAGADAIPYKKSIPYIHRFVSKKKAREMHNASKKSLFQIIEDRKAEATKLHENLLQDVDHIRELQKAVDSKRVELENLQAEIDQAEANYNI